LGAMSTGPLIRRAPAQSHTCARKIHARGGRITREKNFGGWGCGCGSSIGPAPKPAGGRGLNGVGVVLSRILKKPRARLEPPVPIFPAWWCAKVECACARGWIRPDARPRWIDYPGRHSNVVATIMHFVSYVTRRLETGRLNRAAFWMASMSFIRISDVELFFKGHRDFAMSLGYYASHGLDDGDALRHPRSASLCRTLSAGLLDALCFRLLLVYRRFLLVARAIRHV